MSSDQPPLNVNPAELRKHAATFEEIAKLAHESVGRLQAALIQQGTPWGNDGPGKAFAKTCVPEENQGIENMKTVANSLRNFGTQLTAAADPIHPCRGPATVPMSSSCGPICASTWYLGS